MDPSSIALIALGGMLSNGVKRIDDASIVNPIPKAVKGIFDKMMYEDMVNGMENMSKPKAKM